MTRALGIDIGSFSIKIAEIEISSRSRELVGLYEIPRTEGDDAGLLLKDFIAKSEIKAERVAFGMGKAPVFVKKMELPFSDRKRLEPSVKAELEDSLPFEIADHVLDIKALGKRGRIFRYLVGICPKTSIEFFNKASDESGLVANGFHIDAEALGQLAVHQSLPAARDNVAYAVCDIGHDSTKVAILRGFLADPQDRKSKGSTEPGEIAELRTIGHGSNDLVNWIVDRKKLGLEEARQWLLHRAAIKTESSDSTQGALSDEMSDEIKVALRPIVVELYQTIQSFKGKSGGQSLEALYLTGGMSDISGLREFLSEELRLPVHRWPIFLGFSTERMPLSPEKERCFAVATSLAFRFAIRKPVGWLNFRRSVQANKKILTTTLQQFLVPELRPILIGIAASMTFAFVYSATSSYFIDLESKQLAKEVAGEFRRLDGQKYAGKSTDKFSQDSKRSRELFEGERKTRNSVKRSETANNSGNKARSEIMLDVSQIVPETSMLKELTVDSSRPHLFEATLVSDFSIGTKELDALKASLTTALQSRGYASIKLDRDMKSDKIVKVSGSWKGLSK